MILEALIAFGVVGIIAVGMAIWIMENTGED